jgi:RNA polymerase sigma-32 factor
VITLDFDEGAEYFEGEAMTPEEAEEEAFASGDYEDYSLRLPAESGDRSLWTPAGREPARAPAGPVGQGSVHSYINDLKQYKVITPEEEKRLLSIYLKTGDMDAGRRIVTGNLRLVVKIAMEFQQNWLHNIQDLIQEGNLGLIQALKKFDPSRGVKFGFYAAYWIKAYILKYIMDNWRLVKIGTTQAQRKLFFNLKKEQERIQREGLDPTPELLAERLGVSPREAAEMESRFQSGHETSLDTPLGPYTEESQVSVLPSHDDPTDMILADKEARGMISGQLEKFRKGLDERELFILDNRFLSEDPLTLQELGGRFGITRERVRQISERLKDKLRSHLMTALPQIDFTDYF